RTLNGLIPHFYAGEMRGRVVVDGLDTREAQVSELARRVGLVFQNPERMFFSETVLEELTFGPLNLGMGVEDARKRALEVAEEMGLTELLSRPPWSLSGGEMKRLSIASVLTMDPAYVALDEPTVGQDAKNKAGICSMIRRMREESRGVIVVTHDLEWVVDLEPDRIVLMESGSIAADGGREILADGSRLREVGLAPPVCAMVSERLGIGPRLTPREVVEGVLAGRGFG
ncbi:MAG: ABC transporter ATP-binding protein, partial [Candidatus Korarchaeota archaeon]|nr:ABC transporter ATP-binding protein [Candidatus Korarchaeota archaeon]